MFYYLYEIRNNLNGKIYVGVHKTKNLDDGYMGSGKVIKRAIEKHGISNFTKVILETFENAEAMYAREKEIVTVDFLAREDVYNLRRGGFGGFDHLNTTGKNRHFGNTYTSHLLNGRQRKQKMIEAGTWNAHLIKRSQIQKQLYATGRKISSFTTNNPLKTPEGKAKHKQALAKIGHSQGEKNSQFGTRWITNNVENKKITRDSIVPDGWRLGRVKVNK